MERPIIIGLASIWAGGGHNALRDLLLEELQDDKRFETHSFTHSDSSYDWFNDTVLGKAPKFLNFIYKRTPNEYPGVTAIKLVKECEQFVNEKKPDIVISTNFGVCSAFGFIKRTMKLNFINIYAIPDYGKTGNAAFPKNRYFKPDYAFVFDKLTKDGLIEDMEYPREKIVLLGAVARRSFRQIIKDNKHKTKEELIKEINKDIKQKWEIGNVKRTYLISGGAGGAMDKSWELLKTITEYQKEDREFQQNNQFLIIAGQHEEFRNKVNKLRRNRIWQNIYPLPWVNKETYAKCMLVSNIPILITIAPATINELLTAGCGPFIINRYRTGPEVENLAFVKQEGLGIEIKDPKELLKKIIIGFDKDAINDFNLKTKEYLHSREALLADLPASLMTIFNSSIIEKRKKKKLFNINYDLISPKILWTIFVLLIPSSLIFAYAQYFKGKKKITNNPVVKKAGEIKDEILDMNPFKQE